MLNIMHQKRSLNNSLNELINGQRTSFAKIKEKKKEKRIKFLSFFHSWDWPLSFQTAIYFREKKNSGLNFVI